jgi:hypothetical protein
MNPVSNPAGTLAQINNPITNAVTGANQPNQPTATDTAQQPGQPPVMGGANIFSQLTAKGSPYLSKLSSAASQAMGAGVPVLSSLVVGAVHATDPSKDPLSQAYRSQDPSQVIPPNGQQQQQAAQPTGLQKAALGAAGVINGIGAGLGDAGAIGQVPKGAGAFYGISKTLGARSERLQKDQMNKVMMAEANTRMVHEQRLIHNLDEDAKQTSLKNGQQQLETMKATASTEAPVTEIAKGLLSSEIPDYIKSQKLDPTKETAIPSGIKVVDTDKNGVPITQLTYSLVTVPDVNLNANDSDEDKAAHSKATLDFFNKWAPPSSGKWGSDGVQAFTGPQYNLVYQQAHDAVTKDLAIKKAQIQNGYDLDEIHEGEEALKFKKDPVMSQVLATASATGDIMSARDALLQQNADPKSPLYGKYPNLDYDLRHTMGYTEDDKGKKTYVYDKMLDNHQKQLDKNQEIMLDDNKTASKAHGEEAAGLVPIYQDKANKATSPQQKAFYQDLATRAQSAANASTAYDVNKKQQELKVQQDMDEDNIPSLVDDVFNYTAKPEQMSSLRKNQRAALYKAVDERNKTLPPDQQWSSSKYQQRYEEQQDIASNKPNTKGAQIQSLDQFGKHVAQANRRIVGLQNTNSPWLNKPLNEIKQGTQGYPEATALIFDANATKDEFLTFINNGHVPATDEEKKVADTITGAKTASELQAAFREMMHLVIARGSALNDSYYRIMGTNIPKMMTDDTKTIIRQFGFNPDDVQSPEKTTSLSANVNAPSEMKRPPVPNNKPANSVYMKGPDGTFAWVNPNQVQAIASKGGIVIP